MAGIIGCDHRTQAEKIKCPNTGYRTTWLELGSARDGGYPEDQKDICFCGQQCDLRGGTPIWQAGHAGADSGIYAADYHGIRPEDQSEDGGSIGAFNGNPENSETAGADIKCGCGGCKINYYELHFEIGGF